MARRLRPSFLRVRSRWHWCAKQAFRHRITRNIVDQCVECGQILGNSHLIRSNGLRDHFGFWCNEARFAFCDRNRRFNVERGLRVEGRIGRQGRDGLLASLIHCRCGGGLGKNLNTCRRDGLHVTDDVEIGKRHAEAGRITSGPRRFWLRHLGRSLDGAERRLAKRQFEFIREIEVSRRIELRQLRKRAKALTVHLQLNIRGHCLIGKLLRLGRNRVVRSQPFGFGRFNRLQRR